MLLPAHNPSPMTGAGNNTYLVAGTHGESGLIDAGVGHARHLADLARRLLGSRAPLRHVLVTHAHADHASGAPALAREHPGAAFRKYPWTSEDSKYPVSWLRLEDGERVEIGDELLIALHTPGHSPDHLAFWHEESRTLFSGDLVVAGGSVMIHSSGGGDLGEYLASLERVRRLAPLKLLPAHGPEVTDPAETVAQYIRHRLMREEQILAALGRGSRTVETIAEAIYHGLEPSLVPAARENVRAHLAKLKREGRAFEEESSLTWTT